MAEIIRTNTTIPYRVNYPDGLTNENSDVHVVIAYNTAAYTGLLEKQANAIKSQYGENVIIVCIQGDGYSAGTNKGPRYEDNIAAVQDAYKYLNDNFGFDGVADVYLGNSHWGAQSVSLALDDYKRYYEEHGEYPKGATFLMLDARRGKPETTTGFPDFGEDGRKILSETGSKFLIFHDNGDHPYPDSYIREVEQLVTDGIDCVMIGSKLTHPEQADNNIAYGAIPLGLGMASEMSNMDLYTYSIPKRDSSGNAILDSNGRVVWENYKWADLNEEQREFVRQALKNNNTNYHYIGGNYYSNVDFTKFKSLTDKLGKLSELKAISNDQDYVVGLMNEIRSCIKNTTLLSAPAKFTSCTSTTQVPTKAENLLYAYHSAVFNLLDKLSTESEKAISVGTQLDEADKQLAQEVQTIHKTVYVTVPAAVSSNNTVSTTNTNTASTATTTTTLSSRNNNEEKELKPYSVDSLANKNISKKIYNITADDLNRLFDHWADYTRNYASPLRGTGEDWIKACEETDLDPLTLVGICGEETGRGGINGMGWMSKKNFFGMNFIDPKGDGTGPSIRWAGINDPFETTYDAILASCKRIKNFYAGEHGGNTIMQLAHTGYTGHSDSKGEYEINNKFGYSWAAIMKESLDYITGTNGGR